MVKTAKAKRHLPKWALTKKKYHTSHSQRVPKIIPFKSMMKLFKNDKIIFINALPEGMYNDEHIPQTYSFPINKMIKMNNRKINSYIKHIIKKYYPNIYHNIKTHNISLHDVPIVTYCHGPNAKICPISKEAAEKLSKAGFKTTFIYEGGMIDYKKHMRVC